jgi:hypothetical protein
MAPSERLLRPQPNIVHRAVMIVTAPATTLQ